MRRRILKTLVSTIKRLDVMNDFRETKVVVGPARFSYLHVWEPVAIGEGAEKKYSVSVIKASVPGLIASNNRSFPSI